MANGYKRDDLAIIKDKVKGYFVNFILCFLLFVVFGVVVLLIGAAKDMLNSFNGIVASIIFLEVFSLFYLYLAIRYFIVFKAITETKNELCKRKIKPYKVRLHYYPKNKTEWIISYISIYYKNEEGKNVVNYYISTVDQTTSMKKVYKDMKDVEFMAQAYNHSKILKDLTF